MEGGLAASPAFSSGDKATTDYNQKRIGSFVEPFSPQARTNPRREKVNEMPKCCLRIAQHTPTRGGFDLEHNAQQSSPIRNRELRLAKKRS